MLINSNDDNNRQIMTNTSCGYIKKNKGIEHTKVGTKSSEDDARSNFDKLLQQFQFLLATGPKPLKEVCGEGTR